ncbi:polysaccharide biosynthesis tyrosine autokinase [Streptomyces sp. P9(2023)]|uniref:polysaccharide biosynthesis tyrosine autokinase n=1 Tax=Streptomyces sp. P9(2023) TaxID=3064394 RepID=UPI0028F40806|nr:polysaccharide biosynthesis tyrosine autokinase [Streptomyces sp. P9(2023)]MDT9691285.1 polysaccharide biosynthesis tyrosine autokinase [Streptomyces sp. P9(2023)]
MDLRGFLTVVVRRWPSCAACLLLGALAAWAVNALTTPVYEARTQLFVATHAGSDTMQLNQGQSFSQARVLSYADIVNTRQVTETVVKELKLPTTPDELAGRIRAEAPVNTVLIDITVSDTDPRRAARTANAVAVRFGQVVERLETPHTVESADSMGVAVAPVSPVTLGVTDRATVPDVPVSPRPLLNLAVGLLGGLLLGVALAALRETLDTTFKTAEALSELTALPPLATIPFDSDAPLHPITVGEAAHSPRAEAFRRLRTNLQFAQVSERPRIISVTSSLPGEGKTNTAANLAVSLARAGIATCLVDADLRRPCVARTFGLVQDAGLTSVLIGQASAADVTQQATAGLAVLTSGPMPPNPTELLSSARMGEVLQELAATYEVVIVDTAPLLPVADTVGLAPLTQGTLLVVRASKTSREQVRTAVDSLRNVGARPLGAVFNMAEVAKGGYGSYGTYGELPAPRPAVWRRPASEPHDTGARG